VSNGCVIGCWFAYVVIRYLRCRVCQTEFSERKHTALWNTKVREAKAIAVGEHLADGCSLKGTVRLVQVDPSTVRRLNQRLGEHGEAFHDERVQTIQLEALLADPTVDAIYISLPNHLHAQWIVRCAEAKKHILCEKPLTTNFAEAMTAVVAARYHDVFLVEAFMYRCHPQTARLVELIRAGTIGDVRLIQANFSYNMHGPQEDIRQQNAAAGGGIMDVGFTRRSLSRNPTAAATGSASGRVAPSPSGGYTKHSTTFSQAP
jgi:predicted dehydrogenase